MKILLTLAFSSVALFANAATIDVKLVTEGAFHPWNFCLSPSDEVNNSCTNLDLANGHTVAGFDFEYGNALCAKMSEIDAANSYNCSWSVRSWADLSTGVGIGTDYDIVVGQMTALDSRKVFADFVGPYMFTPEKKFISLIGATVTMGGATKISPRMGATGSVLLDCPADTTLLVGVQENTTHYNHVTTYCLNPVTTYSTQADVDTALLNSDVDLMINLTSASKDILTGPSPVAVAHGESLIYPGNGAASLALDKNSSLRSVVNDAVFSLFSTGVAKQIQDKWQ